VALPFVQGRLRKKALSVAITTECAHCGEAIHLEIDSELNVRVVEEGATPLVFVPLLDLAKLEDPSIIDGF
jgi:hypothetical protein